MSRYTPAICPRCKHFKETSFRHFCMSRKTPKGVRGVYAYKSKKRCMYFEAKDNREH